MLKIKKVTSIFQIQPDDYVLIHDYFVKIESASNGFGKSAIKLGVDTDEVLEIYEEDLSLYTFAEFAKETDEIGAELTYRCKVCHNPDIVFDDKEQAQLHVDRCLFNRFTQSCVTCEHLKVIEYPPYPRFEKTYKSLETYHAFGAFKQPYCMKKKQDISEFELFNNHDDCYEYSVEDVITENTPEFEKYIELIMSDDVYSKELSQEEFNEYIQEHGDNQEDS